MRRRAAKLDKPHQRSRVLRLDRLVERTFLMCFQVVHHDSRRIEQHADDAYIGFAADTGPAADSQRGGVRATHRATERSVPALDCASSVAPLRSWRTQGIQGFDHDAVLGDRPSSSRIPFANRRGAAHRTSITSGLWSARAQRLAPAENRPSNTNTKTIDTTCAIGGRKSTNPENGDADRIFTTTDATSGSVVLALSLPSVLIF